MKKIPKGVTLLEIILVLAIASVILVTGLRIYIGIQHRSDLQKLQYNVDTLFQSLAYYYQANCYGPAGTTGDTSTLGALNPMNPASPPSLTMDPTPVDIATLVTNNYLNTVQLLINNPYIDNTGGTGPYAAYAGYVLQFNPTPVTTDPTCTSNCTYINMNACTSPTECTTITTTAPTTNFPGLYNTIILLFQLQVAVKLPSTITANQATTFQQVLGADCISYLDTTDPNNPYVDPCSAVPTTPPTGASSYLVWERLPSKASPNSATPFWQSMPLLKQFNLQYTHDQMFELDSTTGTYYYLCGG